nr:Chain B, Epstein-Barr nuclear antigen 2 [Human herpesvirus 4 strain B95-8]5HDA_D Chain D, Epstein-Barr nuclear antigen 2 [Human herpesvirus 4 strain B95-8]
SMPELSPVL